MTTFKKTGLLMLEMVDVSKLSRKFTDEQIANVFGCSKAFVYSTKKRQLIETDIRTKEVDETFTGTDIASGTWMESPERKSLDDYKIKSTFVTENKEKAK